MLTYGWAITIAVVAIAALAYFGVLDPGKYAPSMCTLPTGLSCLDHVVSTYNVFGTDYNRLELHVKNNLGHTIEVTKIEVAQFNDKEQTYSGVTFANGHKQTITVNDLTNIGNGGSFIPSEQRYEIEFIITIKNTETDLSHSYKGIVTGKVN